MRARVLSTLAALIASGGCNLLTGAADVAVEDPGSTFGEPDGSLASPEPAPEPSLPPKDAGASTPSDAGLVSDGGDAEAGPRGPLRVFVSSQTWNGGQIGGLAGADQKCNDAALAAGLGGKWVAWMSTNQDNVRAVDRLTSDGPWQMVDGQTIATSKADLLDGTLMVALRRTEKNDLIDTINDRVWTGTRPDGTPAPYDCGMWTNAGGNGNCGEAEFANGGRWSNNVVEACGNVNRLYCFEL